MNSLSARYLREFGPAMLGYLMVLPMLFAVVTRRYQ